MPKKAFAKFLVAFIAFFLAAFFLVSYFSKNSVPKNFEDIKYVKIAGQEVKVDLALTSTEQEQGLSGRSGLLQNSGMLFIFAKPSKYYFWMKDMDFPIDIIWLNKNLKVVYIKQEVKPESYPESFGPNTDTQYVLEVPAGFADKNSLKEGDGMEFE